MNEALDICADSEQSVHEKHLIQDTEKEIEQEEALNKSKEDSFDEENQLSPMPQSRQLVPLQQEMEADVGKGRCQSLLKTLDAIDRKYSQRLSKENRLSIELPLILFAHIFNRAFVVIPILLFIVLGAFNYETWMQVNGYKLPHGKEVSPSARFLLGVNFMVFFSLMLLLMVISTTILKKLIRRPRPPLPKIDDVKRMNDLRGREVGTFAMPSGDSAACALCCYLLAHQMKVHTIYFILPMVCLGRVYYHCHWIGDTVVGSIIGTLWGVFGCYFFYALVPLMQLIAGKEFFVATSGAM